MDDKYELKPDNLDFERLGRRTHVVRDRDRTAQRRQILDAIGVIGDTIAK